MYKVFFNNNSLTLAKKQAKDQNFDLTYNYTNKEDLHNFIFNQCQKVSNKSIGIFYYDIDKLWKKFKKLFKIKTAAGGFVKNTNNEFLFIKRRGFWDLPKGHQEKDESINKTAIREVEEECGIKNIKLKEALNITYHTYWLKGKAILKPTHWFLMTYSDKKYGEPQLEEDITEIRWFTPNEFSKVHRNTFPAISEVIYSAYEARFV